MGQPLPPDSSASTSEDLDAMRRDARAWHDCAGRMGEAVATAQGIQLGGYDFSSIGVDSGLVDAYHAAHEWALGLLQGAQTNLDMLGTALAQTADTYQATDNAVAGSFGNLHGELGGS